MMLSVGWLADAAREFSVFLLLGSALIFGVAMAVAGIQLAQDYLRHREAAAEHEASLAYLERIAMLERERDAARALGARMLRTLAHTRWCRDCGEWGWTQCAGGREAAAALDEARAVFAPRVVGGSAVEALSEGRR